jgi:hypothetical protein
MVKKICFISIIFFFSLVNAQSISVITTTDSTKYEVGDYIKYQLELHFDKNINVILPPVKDSVKVLDYLKELPVDSSQVDSKIVKKYTYIFSKYDSAQVTIPSLKIYYTVGSDTVKRVLATTPITITVSKLTINSQGDIKDVKEPLTIPLNWLLIILITIGAIILFVTAFYLYRRYKKKHPAGKDAVPEVIISPHEIALTKLLELEQKKLWQNGFVKEYHSEITDIVRQYFEARFSFRALEMTSAEILAVLSYIDGGKVVINSAESFFSNADLVKFAKFQPMPNVNDEMLKQANEIVTKTIPVPVVEQPVNEVENVQ